MMRVFGLVFTVWMFVGCSGKGEAMMVNSAPMMQAYSDKVEVSSGESLQSPRIITRNANIDVEVENIEQAIEALKMLLEKQQGYIVNANQNEEGHFNASVKVPSQKLDAVLESIGNLGTKLSQSVSQNDVTDQFVDIQARLKNLLLFRDKMKTLLNRASKIEEILKIEAELSRVQTQIDAIQGRLKYLKNAVDMSPIYVSFEEETIYGPLGYVGNGLWWAVKKLFVIK